MADPEKAIMVHKLSDVATEAIGEGTTIWQYVVILAKARIGSHCNICSHVFIENDVVIGDRVTIKCGVQLWDGLRVGNDVFIGPIPTFPPPRRPRAIYEIIPKRSRPRCPPQTDPSGSFLDWKRLGIHCIQDFLAPAPYRRTDTLIWTTKLEVAQWQAEVLMEKAFNKTFIHKFADVSSVAIGEGTRIWQFVVIFAGAKIGSECNICAHVLIENDVVVGDRVTVKSGVQLWDGMRVGDDVFIGPNATFANDKFPRSKQYPDTFAQTIIEDGASIGAGAVVLPGIVIGRGAMVGAGAVVTKDVAPRSLVYGNPAKHVRFLG